MDGMGETDWTGLRGLLALLAIRALLVLMESMAATVRPGPLVQQAPPGLRVRLVRLVRRAKQGRLAQRVQREGTGETGRASVRCGQRPLSKN
jgi:hypothetical protein